jgi:hypothetical protein
VFVFRCKPTIDVQEVGRLEGFAMTVGRTVLTIGLLAMSGWSGTVCAQDSSRVSLPDEAQAANLGCHSTFYYDPSNGNTFVAYGKLITVIGIEDTAGGFDPRLTAHLKVADQLPAQSDQYVLAWLVWTNEGLVHGGGVESLGPLLPTGLDEAAVNERYRVSVSGIALDCVRQRIKVLTVPEPPGAMTWALCGVMGSQLVVSRDRRNGA